MIQAAIRKLLNLQAQLENSNHEKEEFSIDLSKAKKELREAVESIASLNSQLNLDRRTYEQSLEEQEKSCRIRMVFKLIFFLKQITKKYIYNNFFFKGRSKSRN